MFLYILISIESLKKDRLDNFIRLNNFYRDFSGDTGGTLRFLKNLKDFKDLK